MSETPLFPEIAALVAHVAGPFLAVGQHLHGSASTSHTLPVETGPKPVHQAVPPIPPVRRSSLTDAAGSLFELLVETVPRVVGDRAVGLTLSSGMDSSSVAAAAASSGIDVVALTWSVPSVPSADETRWARLTAGSLGVPLVEVEVAPETLLPEAGIVTRCQSPVFNMYEGAWTDTGTALAEHGRDVLLTGYPGDLLFSGWMSPAPDLLLTMRWARLVAYLRRAATRAGGYRSPLRHELAAPIARQFATRWWARRRQPVPWLHPSQFDLWIDLQRSSVSTGMIPSLAERRGAVTNGSLDLLADEPVLTEMGVTQIHPLLDASIVEFALSLPTWLLYDGGLDKMVLRESMRGTLPDEVIALEKRLPRELAIQAMRCREGPLMDLTVDMKAADMEIVDETALRSEVEGFMRGEHTNMEFWNALTLEDWLRRWR